ncbi:MAG: hypothetical protein LBE34_02380 [Flavobacteriaceae bacterium]|jgi:hypothetical protein|nr:hypothetical protein [Flavobacteriaceae bacterium]
MGLCKSRISGLLCLLFLFSSCYKKPKKGREDFIDYYHGVVIGENKEYLKEVEVCIYESFDERDLKTKDSLVKCGFTDKKGYFKIQDSTFTKDNLKSESRSIVFKKEGYELFRMPIIFPESGYRPKVSKTEGMFFIFATLDTVGLRKETVIIK